MLDPIILTTDGHELTRMGKGINAETRRRMRFAMESRADMNFTKGARIRKTGMAGGTGLADVIWK